MSDFLFPFFLTLYLVPLQWPLGSEPFLLWQGEDFMLSKEYGQTPALFVHLLSSGRLLPGG